MISLNINGISKKIENEMELANSIIADFSKRENINQNQLDIINNYGKKILNDTYNEIKKISI